MASSTRYRWAPGTTPNTYSVHSTRTGALVGMVWCNTGVWYAYKVSHMAQWRTGTTPAKALHNASRAANKAALRQAAKAPGATTRCGCGNPTALTSTTGACSTCMAQQCSASYYPN